MAMATEGLGSGDSALYPGVLDDASAEAAFAQASSEFAFEKMVGQRGQPLPRVQCLQCRPTGTGWLPVYRYPGNEDGRRYASHPLAPLTEHVCALAEAELQRRLGAGWAAAHGGAAAAAAGGGAVLDSQERYFNHVVINWYRSEDDFIASHQDKRLDIERNSLIGAVSVYPQHARRRVLELLSMDGQKRRQAVEMPQGSLFLLGDQTNQEFQHSVRPVPVQAEPEPGTVSSGATPAVQARISFTLRRCATYLDPRSGSLHGQGSGYRMAPDGSISALDLSSCGLQPLEVLFMDEHYIVVSKPSGMAVVEGVGGVGGGPATDNGGSVAPALLPRLAAQLISEGGRASTGAAESDGQPTPPPPPRLFPVPLFPIDQGGSGLTLVARSAAAAAAAAALAGSAATIGGGSGGSGGGGGGSGGQQASCGSASTVDTQQRGDGDAPERCRQQECVHETLALVSTGGGVPLPPPRLRVERALSAKPQPNKAARAKLKAARRREARARQQGAGSAPPSSPAPAPATGPAPSPAVTEFRREACLWEHEGQPRLGLVRGVIRWGGGSTEAATGSPGGGGGEPHPPPRRHQVRRRCVLFGGRFG
jgi:23S rRNA-/tRNA-specific pseudouridylate synthase